MKSNAQNDKTLFISRLLSADSPFQSLKTQGWNIIDQSLLKIEYLQVDSIPASDWIFFYSPNGVKAFVQNAKRLNFNFSAAKIAAYGPGTAETLQSLNLHPDFIGTGESEGTLQIFNSIASDSQVLFPLASHSKHALIAEEENTFKPIELIVYENSMSPVEIPLCNVYIFTSSLNVTSFFELNTINADATVIAIGQPTSASLAKHYSGEIKIPTIPTETGLFELVLQ